MRAGPGTRGPRPFSSLPAPSRPAPSPGRRSWPGSRSAPPAAAPASVEKGAENGQSERRTGRVLGHLAQAGCWGGSGVYGIQMMKYNKKCVSRSCMGLYPGCQTRC